ncbi:hypothetical protein [Paraburkholderia youngii]|uniref:DUF8082 domain-containing protein n=1 Tax=Paraburkholderia youngii TaxID=2782701 RepID=A0A7Y6MZ77_9BURK|nr:hypothetical protein [Paraburkholderia youngii]NUX99730.1 hypothetical protein [Paraburkholderia youngii]
MSDPVFANPSRRCFAMLVKALARRPEDRFGSAAEWLASLRSLAVSPAAADDDRTIVTPSAYWSASAALPAHATGGSNPPMPVPSAPRNWPPEMLARIERQLAIHMGPLASLLVRRAATQANDLPALGAQLAAVLPDTARLDSSRPSRGRRRARPICRWSRRHRRAQASRWLRLRRRYRLYRPRAPQVGRRAV